MGSITPVVLSVGPMLPGVMAGAGGRISAGSPMLRSFGLARLSNSWADIFTLDPSFWTTCAGASTFISAYKMSFGVNLQGN